MKQLFTFMLVASVLLFSSCSKDYLSTPTENPTINYGTNGGISTGPLTLMPKLVKHGDRTLTYVHTGDLSSVTYNNGYKTFYSELNNRGPATHVTTNTYQGDTTTRFLYELSSNGLAKSIRYEELKNGEWDELFEDDYTYNTSKQLTKISNSSGHYDFVYNADGDVTSITYINWQNKLIMETYFWYTSGNSAVIDDKNKINPDDLWIDQYLKIFGKFRKHLPRRIKYSNYLPNGAKTDFRYDYVLNADGLIKTEKKYYSPSNVLAETKSYEYQ